MAAMGPTSVTVGVHSSSGGGPPPYIVPSPVPQAEMLQGRVVALSTENMRLRQELATMKVSHHPTVGSPTSPNHPGGMPMGAPPPSYVQTAAAAAGVGSPIGHGVVTVGAPDPEQRYNTLYADYRRTAQQLHDLTQRSQRETQNMQSAVRMHQLELQKMTGENAALKDTVGKLTAETVALKQAQAVAPPPPPPPPAPAVSSGGGASSGNEGPVGSTPASAGSARRQTKRSSELAADAANKEAMVAHLTRLLELKERELAKYEGRVEAVACAVQVTPQSAAVSIQTDPAITGSSGGNGTVAALQSPTANASSSSPGLHRRQGSTLAISPVGRAEAVEFPTVALQGTRPIALRLYSGAPPSSAGAAGARLLFSHTPPTADIPGAGSSGRWCDEPFDADALGTVHHVRQLSRGSTGPAAAAAGSPSKHDSLAASARGFGVGESSSSTKDNGSKDTKEKDKENAATANGASQPREFLREGFGSSTPRAGSGSASKGRASNNGSGGPDSARRPAGGSGGPAIQQNQKGATLAQGATATASSAPKRAWGSGTTAT